MKKSKIALFLISILFLATFSIEVSAISIDLKSQVKKINNIATHHTLFNATIFFQLWVATGCGCDPVSDATIIALGLDIDDHDEGITDQYGQCSLQLEINYHYRITIQAEGYVQIMFDFLVIGEQEFEFHLQEEESSITSISFIQSLLSKPIFSRFL